MLIGLVLFFYFAPDAWVKTSTVITIGIVIRLFAAASLAACVSTIAMATAIHVASTQAQISNAAGVNAVRLGPSSALISLELLPNRGARFLMLAQSIRV